MQETFHDTHGMNSVENLISRTGTPRHDLYFARSVSGNRVELILRPGHCEFCQHQNLMRARQRIAT